MGDETERRRRRTRNALISGLVGALSLSGLAFWQWQLAEFQRQQTITGLTTASQQLFDSNKEFDALLASINAGKQVKQAAFEVNSDLQFQVKIALQQAIYGVKERNRLEGHKAGVFSVSYSPDGKTVEISPFYIPCLSSLSVSTHFDRTNHTKKLQT